MKTLLTGLIGIIATNLLGDTFILKGKAYSLEPEVEIVSVEQYPIGLYVVTTDLGPNWDILKNPENAIFNYPAKILELSIPSVAVYYVSDTNREARIDRLPGRLLYSKGNPSGVVQFDINLFNDWIDVIGFGEISVKNYPWIYHTKYGWFYITNCHNQGGEAAYWLYFSEIGWVWTTRDSFPSVLWINKGIWIELN